jgi:hypothetical protein
MKALVAAIICVLTPHSFGLDISGTVMDKKFSPLASAKICPQSTPETCVLSGADGSFHIQGNVALRKREKMYLADIHSVWFQPDGQAFNLQDKSKVGHWPLFHQNQMSQPNPLLKASAPPALVISKSGYSQAIYQPILETETGNRVLLGGIGETVVQPFNGKTFDGWTQIPAASWTVNAGAMASTGAGRGVLFFKDDFVDYRVIFSVRQVSGDHFPCVLFFTNRPPVGEKGLDALGAVQWQPPGTWGWDYRPGKNNDGGNYFTKLSSPALKRNQWSQCEMIVRSTTGTALMGCCQQNVAGDSPCKGSDFLSFKDPATIGKKGTFAIQMHNGGIHDEYKNISIELNPKSDSLFINQ